MYASYILRNHGTCADRMRARGQRPLPPPYVTLKVAFLPNAFLPSGRLFQCSAVHRMQYTAVFVDVFPPGVSLLLLTVQMHTSNALQGARTPCTGIPAQKCTAAAAAI